MNKIWTEIKDYQTHAQHYLKEVQEYEFLILKNLEHFYPDRSKENLIQFAIDIVWNDLDLDDVKKLLSKKA